MKTTSVITVLYLIATVALSVKDMNNFPPDHSSMIRLVSVMMVSQ